jgi:hypothetical protein
VNMVVQNIPEASVLQHQPLPPEAEAALFSSLTRRGFSEDAFMADYSFSLYERSSHARNVKTNYMVFSDGKRRTPDYTTVSIYNASGTISDHASIVKILAHSAAPLHLIHHDDLFSLWGSNLNGNRVNPISVQPNIGYSHLSSALQDYAVDFEPDRILQVKRGRAQFLHPAFAKIQPLQLSLWAIEVTRPLLVNHFSQAVTQLRGFRHLNGDVIPDDVATRIAIQLLGALVLADTGVLGEALRQENVTLDRLITAAANEFQRYFQPHHFAMYREATEIAYKLMRNIRYSGFLPDMLATLYRAAYGLEKSRNLGRYDTPMYLTRRIWDNIPVEFLRPEQRVVADMSCGWGSFLNAGYERLSRIEEMGTVPLLELLHGNDLDSFTADLAGLGMLLSTSTDSWHVDAGPADRWDWLRREQPNIIVGNPRFYGNRRQGRDGAEAVNEGANKEVSVADKERGAVREQAADAFFGYAIERLAPGGYLAMMMPQSFVMAEASPNLRRQLLKECDIQELWELPIGVFGDARVNTIVVFARKREIAGVIDHTPVRVRTVQRNTLEVFKHKSVFTASAVAPDQHRWWDQGEKVSGRSKKAYTFDYKVILSEHDWDQIRLQCVPLKERASVFLGMIRGKNPLRKRLSNHPDGKQVLWLPNAKRGMPRSWYIEEQNTKEITYPNDLEEPRLSRESQLIGPKILLTSLQNPSWGMRVKVAIEREGYYPSDGFWVITPLAPWQMTLTAHADITLEVLAAVLSWKVSNAWVLEHQKYPKLTKGAIDSIPFPAELTQDDCAVLTAAVHELEANAVLGRGRGNLEAELAIDEVLKGAYGLNPETYKRLQTVANWDKNPILSLDDITNTDSAFDARWPVSGVVDRVDAESETITLWLESFDDLQAVSITPQMPGWLLRPETYFSVRIPYECQKAGNLRGVRWNNFVPQKYTYMSEDEFLASLEQPSSY